MRNLILIFLAIFSVGIVSCSRSRSHDEVLTVAEGLLSTDIDSALSMLEEIEPYDLTDDSLKAKYHYLKAWGHLRQNRSMIGDSLISFAHEYYRGNDMVRDIRSATASAWYKFWVGDTPGAISMFDSIVTLNGVADSLLVQTLRIRVLLGASEYQGRELIPLAKRLVEIETDTMRKIEATCMLVSAYENASVPDSALLLTDGLIGYAQAKKLGDKQILFELQRAQILAEMGRSIESNDVVAWIFSKSLPDNGASDYLHLQRAMNFLNLGDRKQASRELALADSSASRLRSDDDAYYRSYSNLLHVMIDFKETGRMKLEHVNSLNNRQRERFNRMKASQWESERGALQQQSRVLALKAESEHKTVVILVVVFVAFLIAVGAVWVIRMRRHRERENEERIEALQKMVDEFNASSSTLSAVNVDNLASLRRAMLQQLGIIKMVAETPTEQNREMLRRISSIDGETDGELVNWVNLFEIINNLYSGFYDKLHSRYGSTLNAKEEQIIVLMMAGFSTKEISVITGQTTSTIYVRKSSIRKKLTTTEKEDIVAFLRKELV